MRVSAASAAFVGGAWYALGRIVAEKIVTSMALPAGIIWLMLLVAVLAARRAGRFDVMLAIAIPWTVLTLFGNGYIVQSLAASLERPYAQVSPLESEPLDAVVVLGGGTVSSVNKRIQGNASGDRVILAAQMYHAGLTPQIVCTGRRIEELNPQGRNPAEQSKAILVSLNVPADVIKLLDGRNTSEEMTSLGKMFGDADAQIGLITSAWHLPRAMRLAKRNQFVPQPLPADFISRQPGRKTTSQIILDCIPQDVALWTSSKLIKEYLGMLVGR